MGISCTWSGSKDLPCDFLPPGEAIDESEDAVELDSVVQLFPPEGSDDSQRHPEFTLCSSANKLCMKEILLVAVGLKRVEIFAESGEYIETVSGSTLIPDPDFQIEAFKIPGHGRSYLKIKGHLHENKKSEPSSIYILNVQVCTGAMKSSQTPFGHFDISQVNKLLDQQTLTKNAEDFKSMFESFQAGKSKPGPFPLPLLSSKITATPPSPCKCSQDLEKRVMDRIDTMEKRMQDKLDVILSLLNKNE